MYTRWMKLKLCFQINPQSTDSSQKAPVYTCNNAARRALTKTGNASRYKLGRHFTDLLAPDLLSNGRKGKTELTSPVWECYHKTLNSNTEKKTNKCTQRSALKLFTNTRIGAKD